VDGSEEVGDQNNLADVVIIHILVLSELLVRLDDVLHPVVEYLLNLLHVVLVVQQLESHV